MSRYLRRLRPKVNPEKAKQWMTFLHNHRHVMATFDFFTDPKLSFGTMCCFFVIKRGRQRILAFNCAAHPTSDCAFGDEHESEIESHTKQEGRGMGYWRNIQSRE